MKFSHIFAEAALHSRAARIMLNAGAVCFFPKHREFYLSGIRRELCRKPESKLGRLLAASHDQRRLHAPR